ncbi:outer membrane lipid asymmetry maintenance protein MlaD [Kaustia mangrovi]|uniref:Outer membrane lipid asymmetry maintenance protein MlaD n=1 Tax=Kaustia mangrovi TaxID=2593653 RepID=A0A7S8C7H3_9HYPH|nr:outer membrane lipid asymmetry maintenance protein MlaD [Kaustia mangrovi]QPC44736.1 outer membrane lipid asymmetry maintenance protein MlaD [Kaustia mangrovi]
MKQTVAETLIGAVVIAVAGAFFTFVYTTSGIGSGSDGYRVVAEFQNVEGVSPGTDVRMSGIKVGTVVDQSLDSDTFQALLTLSIDNTIKLPEDSSAKITSEGLLGSKFVALEAGGSQTMLKNGDHIIYTQSAIDIWGLIGQAMFNKGDDDK